MRHLVLLLIGLLAFSQTSFSQKIIDQQNFHIQGYQLGEKGYPRYIIPGTAGEFIYLEYWQQNVDGHPFSNYYVQCYDAKGFAQVWFKPVTNEGFEPMAVSNLVRLNKGFYVVGTQYFPPIKRTQTVGRYFSFDGRPSDSEPVQFSSFKGKTKKIFTENITSSGGQRALLWYATDGVQTMASAWTNGGVALWQHDLTMPEALVEDKFQVKEATIDDNGNAYFLMESALTGTKRSELEFTHALVRFDVKKDTIIGFAPIALDSGEIQSAYLKILQNGDVILTGIANSSGIEGISNINEQKEADVVESWTHFYMRRYRYDTDFKVLRESAQPLPTAILNRYKEKNTHFCKVQIRIQEEVRQGIPVAMCFLMFEEFFTSKERVHFNDVMVVCFDVEKTGFKWAQIIEKRQRTQNSAALLSYVSGMARGKLRLVYLTELGAPGELTCATLDVDTGELTRKSIASNENGNFLFLPANSAMISPVQLVLIGLGISKDDYRITNILF